MVVTLEQPENALLSITVTVLLIVIEVAFVQFANALLPMSVTQFPTDTVKNVGLAL